MKDIKKYQLPIIMLIVFEAVAVTLWLTLGNIFYLFNFSYIGVSVALGVFLYVKKYKHARRITQLLVGLYMLVYLGIISNENMQIEGFWYYLFTGVFEAATIHYAVAKIFGPLIFGRGWCGYACWTAMVLDFLPYKTPRSPRKKLGWIRYITFAVSLVFVAALFLSHVGSIERIMFWSFIIGNVLYYAVGIALAFVFKDNRAFCKYICPITVFLKPMSYFALFRIKCDNSKCVSCGKCKKVCPMDVDMTDNSRKRKNGTECILCFECAKECPKKSAVINVTRPRKVRAENRIKIKRQSLRLSFYLYPILIGLFCKVHLQLRCVGNIDIAVLVDVAAAQLRRVEFLEIRRILLNHRSVCNAQIPVRIAVADCQTAQRSGSNAATAA